MKSDDLKPIGSEFNFEFPVPDVRDNPLTTLPVVRSIHTFRVVAHDPTIPCLGYTGKPILMNRVETIRIRSFPQKIVYGIDPKPRWHYEDDPDGEWTTESEANDEE